MKKGLKKAIAATVASVIFLSLAGCGASPAEASKSGTETTAKKETKAASEADGTQRRENLKLQKERLGTTILRLVIMHLIHWLIIRHT